MKRFTTYRLVPTVMAGCLVMLTGCATTSPPVKMVPYLDYSNFSATGKTIRVAEVRIGEIQTPSQELEITGAGEHNENRQSLVRAFLVVGMDTDSSDLPEWLCNLPVVAGFEDPVP